MLKILGEIDWDFLTGEKWTVVDPEPNHLEPSLVPLTGIQCSPVLDLASFGCTDKACGMCA